MENEALCRVSCYSGISLRTSYFRNKLRVLSLKTTCWRKCMLIFCSRHSFCAIACFPAFLTLCVCIWFVFWQLLCEVIHNLFIETLGHDTRCFCKQKTQNLVHKYPCNCLAKNISTKKRYYLLHSTSYIWCVLDLTEIGLIFRT